jgi:integrase
MAGEIARARGYGADPVSVDAAWIRQRLAKAKSEEEREWIREVAEDMATSISDIGEDDPQDGPSMRESKEFFAAATDTATDAHLDDWIVSLNDEAKTKAMKRTDVARLAAKFPFVAQITKRAVQAYGMELIARGLARATVVRALSSWRGYYWTFLQMREVAPEDLEPFNKINWPNENQKQAAKGKRRAFEPSDVVDLWTRAKAQGDQELADFIKVGAYTGARREELAAMPVDHVDLKAWVFNINDAKTPAGNRQTSTATVAMPSLSAWTPETAMGFTRVRLSQHPQDGSNDAQNDVQGWENEGMRARYADVGASLAQRRDAIAKLVYPKVNRQKHPSRRAA